MPNPTKNKIPQIKTGHHVPVAPETANNTVATPRTTVTIVNRFHSMPSSIPVGAARLELGLSIRDFLDLRIGSAL